MGRLAPSLSTLQTWDVCLRQAGEEVHVVEQRVEASTEPELAIVDMLLYVQLECRQIEAGGAEVFERAVVVNAERLEVVKLHVVEVVAQSLQPPIGHGKGLLRRQYG